MPTTPITSGKFTFYTSADYFAQLCADINETKKGGRVLLATMAFYPEVPEVQRLIIELCHAAQRGVQVNLSIDAYAFLEIDRGGAPLILHRHPPKKLPGALRHLDEALRRLQAAGVTVTITNLPMHRLSLPFAGRSHAKVSIINDIVYLGGCNLAERQLDCMVKWRNPDTARWLYDLFSKRHTSPETIAAFGATDIHHRISGTEELIFDVGVKRQSAIYEEALAVIDRAENWLVITCQFFPNTVTAKHLKMAHNRGVKIIPIFNHYMQHSHVHKALQAAVTYRERLHMPRSFFEHQLKPSQTYLHAKILASEHESIIGSHNYITAGVLLGTAEIALHSTDPAFGWSAVQTIVNEVEMPDIMQALKAY